ncbi:hypothetical protein VII00023_22949 [Vibrio ichthyoenteri ATCC 700023]|uniref:Uncharacterized protein n=1 Tax=Vibrio ichthyoenteri ATCC 700023 TaxID=870968 RepID=F9S7J5_9VIBR|nr:hypothetical protein [Vibrio ichthyoenteri]EGU31291.1 hypothetical protein VII00023_22949 [Vibrio ichthyoenteri ATCC 700023]
MQYAAMKLSNANILLDANEIYALDQGLDKLIESMPDDEYESTLCRQVVYGVYIPQIDFDFPKSEIKRHIEECVNNWLIHINGLHAINIGIEDIEPYYDVTITGSCAHCPKPHTTNKVAFAALLIAPKDFKLGNGKTQAKTAYLRWFDMDILTTLLNRKGLFSLIAPEKRFKSEPTLENWRTYIDPHRAVKYAQKWR